jgi:hypothetical protein
MMLQDARNFLTKALDHVGLPERYVIKEQKPLDEYPTAPVAFVYFTNGAFKRDGSRTKWDGRVTTRRMWSGRGNLRLELFMRDETELGHAVQGILEYLFEHDFQDNDGNHHKFADGDVHFSYQNDEGILPQKDSIALEFPVELGIYKSVRWIPLKLELEGILELNQAV